MCNDWVVYEQEVVEGLYSSLTTSSFYSTDNEEETTRGGGVDKIEFNVNSNMFTPFPSPYSRMSNDDRRDNLRESPRRMPGGGLWEE